jgi:hypothetical protein
VTRAALASLRAGHDSSSSDDSKGQLPYQQLHDNNEMEEKESKRRDNPAPLFANLVEQRMIADAAARGDVGRVSLYCLICPVGISNRHFCFVYFAYGQQYGCYYPRSPSPPPLSTLDVIQTGHMKLSTNSGVAFTKVLIPYLLPRLHDMMT